MFASTVHLMLTRVLTVGLAVIVRSSAGAITVFVLLLFAPAILPERSPDLSCPRHPLPL